jgi:hypothetical protein
VDQEGIVTVRRAADQEKTLPGLQKKNVLVPGREDMAVPRLQLRKKDLELNLLS